VKRVVFVCRKCKRHECLTGLLERRDEFDVELVRCQKICHGPVAGVAVGGSLEWFERVDDVRSIAALVRLARRSGRSEKIPKPLRRHRVKKVSGRAPRR
jgi:hypothetical protein